MAGCIRDGIPLVILHWGNHPEFNLEISAFKGKFV